MAGSNAASQYTDDVLAVLSERLAARVDRLQAAGAELPAPDQLAALLEANLPDVPAALDPYYADLAPFYTSDGAMRQLGDISKQALQQRRSHGSVLALRTGDGTWLYPAWQFTGAGSVHPVLAPVLRALRQVDGWVAGTWLVQPHPDLEGRSPREALRAGRPGPEVAELAAHDVATLVA